MALSATNYVGIHEISADAGEDLTGKVGFFVTYNATGGLVVATTAQGPCVGVLTLEGESGQAVKYATFNGGHAPVIAGAAITAGTRVAVGADGRAVAFVDNVDGNLAMGLALTEATAAGEKVRVSLTAGLGVGLV